MIWIFSQSIRWLYCCGNNWIAASGVENFVILTDSGGIQEETTALGVPCITMRDNTERPITTEIGTNVLAGTNNDKIIKILKKFLNGEVPVGIIPPLWDGKASIRTAEIIKNELG